MGILAKASKTRQVNKKKEEGGSLAHIAADNSGVTDAAHPRNSQHIECRQTFELWLF